MRVAHDAGMELEDCIDDLSIRKHRESTRLRAILQMNMGSAMGMATPSEILFPDPLAPCGRWGDRVQQQYAARGVDSVKSIDRDGGIGFEARPRVPGPLQLDPAASRMGPHGSPEALHRVDVPICSYAQMIEEARSEASGNKVATAATGITLGVSTISKSEVPVPDRDAEAENGSRVWPPSMMTNGSTGPSIAALEIAKQIQGALDAIVDDPKLLACAPSLYPATVEDVLLAKSTPAASRDAFAALGLGALSCTRSGIAGAGRRAHLVSAAAYATGHGDLGDALRKLALGPITSCARKPWG